MSEMNDEELKEFVKSNMDRIRCLLEEEKDHADKLADEAKDGYEKAKSSAHELKSKAEENAKCIYDAFMNPEAHRHFIRMGMELFMGLNEIVSNMPMPGPVKKMREDFEESTTHARGEFCKANPECKMKKKLEQSDSCLEKIELN